MTVDPQLVGAIALGAALFTVGALAYAIRRAPRALLPDHIWMEGRSERIVKLYCRHCHKDGAIILPVRCEGAMLILEVFAGQHGRCLPQPVTFV